MRSTPGCSPDELGEMLLSRAAVETADLLSWAATAAAACA
jgi:hypothetical protein